jgi:hypothetical protein
MPRGIIPCVIAAALVATVGVSALFAVELHPSNPEVAFLTLPSPGTGKSLYEGCNNLALTFPGGTPSETVVDYIDSPSTVQSLWRHDAAQNRFEGFSPLAPQASDLLTVNFLDAVWICVVPCEATQLGNPEEILFHCISEPLIRRTEAAHRKLIETTNLPYRDPQGDYSIKYLPGPSMFDVDTGATTWQAYAERRRKAVNFFNDRGIDPCRIFVNWGADPILPDIPMPLGLDFGCPVNL